MVNELSILGLLKTIGGTAGLVIKCEPAFGLAHESAIA